MGRQLSAGYTPTTIAQPHSARIDGRETVAS
jgi:hypothetical protein